MFRSNSEKRIDDAIEEVEEFFERRDKIERVLIMVFTAIITAIIMWFVTGMK